MFSNQLILDNRTINDLECILNGSFHPLKTFMNKKDWESVCTTLHMSSGEFFPLPINLFVNQSQFIKNKWNINTEIFLVDKTNLPLAKLIISDYYHVDFEFECKNAYNTFDDNHPYVEYKKSLGVGYYLSGVLTKLNDIIYYDYLEYRKTPQEIKQIFIDKNWTNVIGFQTRNPLHRSHYELTKYALNKTKSQNTKLFLNPVVGITQESDINYKTRMKCYIEILKKYKQDNLDVILSILPLSMRMAGPKEALLHALIRKNYGCTHFIVGRDHASPSKKSTTGNCFYKPYEAQELMKLYYKNIGIQPIFSNNIIYNKNDGIYYPEDLFPINGEKRLISGTQLREMLKNNIPIPNWFSFAEVINILQKEHSHLKNGICFYFIGLPCSGKTTYANKLHFLIQDKFPQKTITILDGDDVRNNLSYGLGFTKEDRSRNVRRIGWVAAEITKHGGIVICANIAPYENDRKHNRKIIENNGGVYYEIFVDTDLDICIQRDSKGLYKKALSGEIKNFTGINDTFEIPINPHVILNNDNNCNSLNELLDLIN